MCFNCGCGMPNNDMGDPNNITTKTFEQAAQAMGQPVREARMNTLELLRKVLAAQQENKEIDWKPQ